MFNGSIIAQHPLEGSLALVADVGVFQARPQINGSNFGGHFGRINERHRRNAERIQGPQRQNIVGILQHRQCFFSHLAVEQF